MSNEESFYVSGLEELDFLDAVWLKLRNKHSDSKDYFDVIALQREWWDIYQDFKIERIKANAGNRPRSGRKPKVPKEVNDGNSGNNV